MSMFRFETLEIWQIACNYINDVYKTSSNWLQDELFGLVSQIRRSVVSVAANIAEGSASSTVKDYRHFFDHARKSLFEAVSHILVAYNLGYITKEEKQELYKKADLLSCKIVVFKKSLR